MKVVTRANYRVVTYPDIRYMYGDEEKYAKSASEEIKDQIKRHVDGLEQVDIECDIEETCSFCGFEWEVSNDPDENDWKLGQPICCDEAADEFDRDNTHK